MPTPTTRRQLVGTAAAALAALPAWMPRLSFAPRHSAPRGDVLVCIFLRGAADGLNMVVPHGEAAYYAARPTLAIPRPDDQRAGPGQRTNDLDGFFGLHPALHPLRPAWEQGDLAFVHACGIPEENRSHFQAMELMERGVIGGGGPASGWIGRHLAALDTDNGSPLRAIGFSERLQRSLHGPVPAVALRSIADFHLRDRPEEVAQMQAALTALYTPDTADLLHTSGAATLEVLATLDQLDPARYVPAPAASYPESDFGMGLRQIAMLIKAEVGLEVACIDVGGWDTHIAQGGSEGWMAGLLADLSAGLHAFSTDLHAHTNNLLVVALSEFGRRVHENGGAGTDHGHGGLMLLLGGGVAGGQVHGAWPGLDAGHLIGPGDMAVTTDYRDILAELVAQRLNNPQLDAVFPDYAPTFRGVVHSR